MLKRRCYLGAGAVPCAEEQGGALGPGFYDYMNKLEQEMNEVRIRFGGLGIAGGIGGLRAI